MRIEKLLRLLEEVFARVLQLYGQVSLLRLPSSVKEALLPEVLSLCR